MSIAQNLVVNGDFESYTICPNNYAQITRANNWIQPTPGTPDYFNTCSAYMDPLNNLAGSETPNSGNGFGGIVLINSSGIYREYIQTRTTKPLLKDRVYMFEMYVSLGDSSNYASNKLAVHISADSIYSDSTRLAYTPQITSSNIIYTKSGWTKISALYKATGGEKYITIGCFESSNASNLVSYMGGGGSSGTYNSIAYYYIDDVSLIDPNCDSVPPNRVITKTENICPNQSTFSKTLSPSNGGITYLWNDSSNNYQIQAYTVGKYWVYTYTGTCPYIDTFIVKYTNAPILNIGNDTTLCSSNSFVLRPKHGLVSNYLWSTNSTDSIIEITNNGSYWLKITDNFGCVNADTVNVNFVVIPNFLGNDIDLCNKQSFPIKISGSSTFAASYLWNTNSTDSFIIVSDTGRYTIKITKLSCTLFDTILVKNTYMPSLNLGNDTLFCNGNLFHLDAPLVDSYKWYSSSNLTNPNFSFLTNTRSINVSTQGYYALGIFKNTCSSFDTIKLQSVAKPTVNLGNDTLLCYGTELLITNKTPSIKNNWQNGDTTNTFKVKSNGIYWLKVSNFVCDVVDTIRVNYENEQRVNLGNDTTFCSHQEFNLIADTVNVTNLKWNNNNTTKQLNIKSNGIYWLEGSKGNCKVRDTILVNIIATPTVNLGPDTLYCKDHSFIYKASFLGASYLWNTNSTDSFITANTQGTYWVEVNNNGCKARDSVNITVFPLEKFWLGNDTILCEGNVLQLNAQATNATHYMWSNGDTSKIIKPTQSGVYWAEASASICNVRDSILIDFKPLPKVNLGNDTTICSNEKLVLNAQVDSATYLWSDLTTQKTLTVNSLGYYAVTVTKNGCSATDGISVLTETAPVLNLGNDTTLCVGYGLTLQSNIAGAEAFLWQDNSVFPFYNVANAGKYTLQIKKGNCFVKDSITVNYVNKETVSLGNDTSYCFNSLVTLKPLANANTYLWQDGSSLNYFEATKPGIYWVEINSATCRVTDSVTLLQKELPIVDLGIDKKVCIGEKVSLDAQNIGANYWWNNGSQNQKNEVYAPSINIVKVTNSLGCYSLDTISLDTFEKYNINLGQDTFVCENGVLKLVVSGNYQTYLWNDGSTKESIIAKNGGKYFLTVTNANNCAASDTILLTKKSKPFINIASQIRVCDPNFNLNAGTGFIQYLWQDGSTNSYLKITDYGQYKVTVIDSNYCTNEAQTEVINYCDAQLQMPNAFTPNTDNLNDEFKPIMKNVSAIDFKIYNRWGQLVFETNDLNKGWNGDSNATDVYYYVINYVGTNQMAKTISGNFTLLR